MGGAVDSVGGFLGLGSGPNMKADNNNYALAKLNEQGTWANNSKAQGLMDAYQNGNMSLSGLQSGLSGLGLAPEQEQGFANDLATGALTGSNLATQQVQANPLLSQGLNQMEGQLQTGQNLQSGQTGILNDLQSQGFQLKPEDQTLYGQTSGNIARLFGQQGNQAASDLANRGLSQSGAAGATFSGLAGNQNEQLAQAQQNIMQQRFQNTQNQIAQQQSFINSLNSQNNAAAGNYASQGASDVNQQFGRNMAGINQQQQNLQGLAGLQSQANNGANASNMAASEFNQANKPMNFMDYATSGVGSSLYNGFAAPGKFASSAAGSAGQGLGGGMMGG